MNRYTGKRCALICMLLGVGLGIEPTFWAVSYGQPTTAQQTATQPSQSSAGAIEQYNLAARYQKLEQYDLAAQEWERLVGQHPRDPLAAAGRHYLGVCQFQLGQFDLAASTLQGFVDRYPQHELLESALTNLGLAHYNRALALQEDAAPQAYRQAIGVFDQQRQRFPQGELLPSSEFYRGESLYALGQTTTAVQVYTAWLKRYASQPAIPETLDTQVRLALATAQLELSKPTAALTTLTPLGERQLSPPVAAELALRRGEALLATQQYDKAAAEFATAAGTEEFADADYALQQQAAALFQLQQYAEAAQLYANVVERFPNSPLVTSSRLAAGKCYYQTGEFNQAANYFAQAYEVASNDLDLAHWWVQSLAEGGQTDAALATVQKLLEKRQDAQLLLDQANLLYTRPLRRQQALVLYMDAAKLAADVPGNDELAAEARYLAAATALELGKPSLAAAQAQQLLDDYPASSYALPARQTIAEAWLQSGDAGKAVTHYRDLLPQGDESQRRTWSLRLAWALSALGESEQVVATLQPLVDQLTPAERVQAEYLLGQAFFRLEQYDAAVVSLRQATQGNNPHQWSGPAQLLLARVLAQKNQPQQAIDLLTPLLTPHPTEELTAEAYFRRGEIHQQQGHAAAAQHDYAAVFQQWPNSPLAPHAEYQWGMLAMEGNNYSAAAGRFAHLVATFPQHPLATEAALQQAQALSRSGDNQAAVTALTSLPSHQSEGDPRIPLAQGKHLAALGNYAEAIAILHPAAQRGETPAAKDFPHRDQLWYELAWAYTNDAQPEQARAAFAHLAGTYPESPLAADALYRVGEADYHAERYESAIESLRTASKHPQATDSLREKAFHLLGWSLAQQGEHAEAAQAFAHQLENVPAGPLAGDAHWLIGEQLFQAGQYALALAAFEQARHQVPQSDDLVPLGMLHAGQAAGQLEKWPESANWLAAAVAQFPDYAGRNQLEYELGWAKFQQGKIDLAMPLFSKVAKEDRSPLGAQAEFMVGELLLAKKEYEQAIRSFFRVAYGYGDRQAPTGYHPWQGEALFEAARCLEQLDRASAAQKLYAELLERFPQHAKAVLVREQITQQ